MDQARIIADDIPLKVGDAPTTVFRVDILAGEQWQPATDPFASEAEAAQWIIEEGMVRVPW